MPSRYSVFAPAIGSSRTSQCGSQVIIKRNRAIGAGWRFSIGDAGELAAFVFAAAKPCSWPG
eukprot:6119425-Lingulodinium_polyedra.AAC.1